MSVESNQNGTLTILAEEFEQNPDKVTSLLGAIGFFPYDCQYDGVNEVFRMVGFCRRFKSLSTGEPAPYYKIVIREDALLKKILTSDDVEVINIQAIIELEGDSSLTSNYKKSKPTSKSKLSSKVDKLFNNLNTDISH